MMYGLHGAGWAGSGYVPGFAWGGLFLVALAIAVVALLVVLVVKISRGGRPQAGSAIAPAAASGKAFEILAERFARGEIDAEAFRSMRAELEAERKP
jgi:uncharacterized membrane protein